MEIPKINVYSVANPDVFWYYLNNLGTQKNALQNFILFSTFIFSVKTEYNSLKNLKQKYF